MAAAGAAAIDLETLAGLHVGRRALFLEAAEECGHGHVERSRECVQGRQRGRGAPVLDFGEHARREVGLAGELGDGHVEASWRKRRTCRPIETSSAEARCTGGGLVTS